MNPTPHALRTLFLALSPLVAAAAQEPAVHTLPATASEPEVTYAALAAAEDEARSPRPHLVVLSAGGDPSEPHEALREPWLEALRSRGWVLVSPRLPDDPATASAILARLFGHLIVTRSVEGLRFHALVGPQDRLAAELVSALAGWLASVATTGKAWVPPDPLPEFLQVATLPAADRVAALEALRPHTDGAPERLLDAFHRAAAQADEERYFACFAADGVFLGTDPRERWTREEFHAWALPYFQRASAWVFVPQRRHVVLSLDGAVAWFHEILWNASYGECRGSGALLRGPDGWRIAQYDLTKPIPNERMRSVCDLVDRDGSPPTIVYVVRHAEKVARPGERDPELDATGRRRADALARVLGPAGIDTLFATEWRRTRETLEPLAHKRSLEIATHPARDSEGLARRIRAECAGRRVAIAGHSNTVPAILRALGAADAPELTEEDYDDLFVLTLDAAASRTVLLHLHYGPSDGTPPPRSR